MCFPSRNAILANRSNLRKYDSFYYFVSIELECFQKEKCS